MLKGMPLSPRARTPPVAAKGTLRKIRSAGPEWKAWVTTALKTGLRVGELLALTWEDVDLVAGRLVVRRTLWRDQEGTPKGGRSREVPLSGTCGAHES
jgi:integrase